MIDASALHRAAFRVSHGAGTPYMDALADAAATFIHEAHLSDEDGVPFVVEPKSLGYGILLGFLAAEEGR